MLLREGGRQTDRGWVGSEGRARRSERKGGRVRLCSVILMVIV